MAKVLITGGAGRLGRLCVREFGEHGHEVAILDRFRPQDTSVAWETDAPAYTGELWDGEAVERAVSEFRPEIIVHLAANPGPSDHPNRKPRPVPNRGSEQYRSVPRDDTFKSNVLGTYYVLDAAVRHGVSRLVAASSFFVLGIGNRISEAPFVVERLPIEESHPNRPEDTYSLSKLLNEEMYQAYSRAYGLRTVALRLLGVYYHGLEQPGRFRDRPLPPGGAGGLANVWMYVDGRDAALAFRLAAEADGLAPFEAFYIGTGRNIEESPREWLERYHPDLVDRATALGEWDTLVSFDRARRLLGYEPRHFWLDEYADVKVTSERR